jgi:murein DD-endopeptidase
MKRLLVLVGVVACVVVIGAGCASHPVKPVSAYTPAAGEMAVHTALAMIGRPYKYQGDSPEGFDCSGLVRYCYLTAGLDLPHGTKALLSVTKPVDSRHIAKGDLLFFHERRKKDSHVGISVGGSQFVHAPATGEKVRKDSLADPYWKKSFDEARRLL